MNVYFKDGNIATKNLNPGTYSIVAYAKNSTNNNASTGSNTAKINKIPITISTKDVTVLYNTWKNRNITTASQVAQNITDSIKSGEVLADDIMFIVDKMKENQTTKGK